VLSVVDLIVDPLKKAKELGPSLRYLTKNLSNDYKGRKPSPQEYLQIRMEIENKIADSCNNIEFEPAINYYRELFELEKDLHPKYLNAKGEWPKSALFDYTVTTNYDLLLERYSFACDLDESLPTKHFFRRGFTRDYTDGSLDSLLLFDFFL
jgi:hypothetical protein